MSPPGAKRRPTEGRRRNHRRQTVDQLEGSRSGEVRSHPLPAGLITLNLPTINAAVEQVKAKLLGDRSVLWCAHRHPSFAIVCGQHPAAGVRCPECWPQHVARHDRTAERTCDACGAVDEDILGFVAHHRGMLNVIDRRSKRSTVIGDITIAGFGICTSCARLIGIAA